MENSHQWKKNGHMATPTVATLSSGIYSKNTHTCIGKSSLLELLHVNACLALGGWVPRNLGAGAANPNPGSKSMGPKSLPYPQPATSPASHTQPQPKHPSHRARSSMEIMITVIINNNNNSNNSKVIKTKGGGGQERTLKHSEN